MPHKQILCGIIRKSVFTDQMCIRDSPSAAKTAEEISSFFVEMGKRQGKIICYTFVDTKISVVVSVQELSIIHNFPGVTVV